MTMKRHNQNGNKIFKKFVSKAWLIQNQIAWMKSIGIYMTIFFTLFFFFILFFLLFFIQIFKLHLYDYPLTA